MMITIKLAGFRWNPINESENIENPALQKALTA